MTKATCTVYGACLGILVTLGFSYWDQARERADRYQVTSLAEQCGYNRAHPIAEVVLEMYRTRRIPAGTFAYYASMVSSENDASKLKECLPDVWS